MRPSLPTSLCFVWRRPCQTCIALFRQRRRERFDFFVDQALADLAVGRVSSSDVAYHIEVGADIADGYGVISEYTDGEGGDGGDQPPAPQGH